MSVRADELTVQVEPYTCIPGCTRVWKTVCVEKSVRTTEMQ